MKREILNFSIAALFVLSISTIITSCGSTDQKQEQETHQQDKDGEDQHSHKVDGHNHK